MSSGINERRSSGRLARHARNIGLAAGLLPLVGCATAPVKPNTTESDRTIAELRAKNAGDARRIEELENRIFILEDRLDSRRLASEQRAPATLPPRAAPAPAPVAAAPAAEGPSSMVAERDVEYGGAALSDARGSRAPAHRPMLRLGGAPEPVEHAEVGAPVESLRLYRHALETLRAGDPRKALDDFRRFLDGNPRHDYADNAQYWIGECYYDLRDFRAAEPEFRKVIERYPDGNKVPDAMLKLGLTLMGQGQDAAGQGVLESLTRAYPKHEAARMAAYRLAHPDADPLALPSASNKEAGKAAGPVLGTVVPPGPHAERQRP